jgi:hypothetical protein
MTAAASYRAACHALGLPVWRPGMLSTYLYRFVGDGLWAKDGDLTLAAPIVDEEPDFTDPATVGCLLAAVREAWGDRGIHVRPVYRHVDGYRWSVFPGGQRWATGRGDTEADALIAALEVAARRGGQP